MAVATQAFGGSADAPAPADRVVVRVNELAVGEFGPATFDLHAGEVVILVSRPEHGGPVIMGATAGLHTPTSGTVAIDGRDLSSLAPAEARRVRYDLVGYVLRDIGLDPEVTVAENMAAPIGLTGRASTREDAEWLARLAQSFGVVEALDRRAGTLEVGMQQRVAIARALATRPSLVYAEDPTAKLDERDGRIVLALLRTIAHEFGIALVISTRDPATAGPGERVIALRDGVVVGDRRGMDTAWLSAALEGGEQADLSRPRDHSGE